MNGRLLLGALGVAVAAYGVLRLLRLGLDNLVATAWWLAGGVLVHDAVIAPMTILVAAVAWRVLPAAWRAPVAAGFVVLGTVTLTAFPVLGGFGRRADNPTLLDRNYWLGWSVVAALVLAAVVVVGLVRRRTP